MCRRTNRGEAILSRSPIRLSGRRCSRARTRLITSGRCSPSLQSGFVERQEESLAEYLDGRQPRHASVKIRGDLRSGCVVAAEPGEGTDFTQTGDENDAVEPIGEQPLGLADL